MKHWTWRVSVKGDPPLTRTGHAAWDPVTEEDVINGPEEMADYLHFLRSGLEIDEEEIEYSYTRSK